MFSRSGNSRMRRPAALASAVLMVAVLTSPGAQAAEIIWRSDNFSYLAQHKPLQEFIREFAASQGLTVVIAPNVEATINGKFDLTPQSMLELLVTSFGLMWYFDGRVLYVHQANDSSSELIRLGTTTVEELEATLRSLDIADSRFPLAYDREGNTALVSGPKHYVDLVVQAARAIDENERARGVADIRVFLLRYAWAADFSYMEGGRARRLPGVASVLRELYSPSGRGTPAAPPAPSVASDRLDRMRGLGLFRDEAVTSTITPARAAREAEPAPIESQELPQFQPDGRMNAVVVRDRPEHMAFYEAVIRALDVKPGLVEIEARVLEVSSDAIDSLGIDWRLHSGSADLQFSRGNLPNPSFDGALSDGAPGAAGGSIPDPGVTPPVPSPNLQRGGVLTTVLGDSGRYLIARVNALAQHGKANILASPRVLTLDNVEAVLENINTFFVRVAGNLEVGLFDVSAGTSLRVTPLIVTEDGRTQVKLAIRIEDGSLTGQSVDRIPVVQRSTIGTQAFIAEGSSLLIGGYESDIQRDTHVGVPGLSKIPLLGRLFRFREKQTTHVQRLFLLTPRVVQP